MGIASSTVDPALRTRAFARVIGPFVATVTTIIAVRAGDLGFLGDSFSGTRCGRGCSAHCCCSAG